MDIIKLREKLHGYIDTAEEQHLTAIYTLVQHSIAPEKEKSLFDEATINMFYQRRRNHRKGISRSYSTEESFLLVRQHNK